MVSHKLADSTRCVSCIL